MSEMVAVQTLIIALIFFLPCIPALPEPRYTVGGGGVIPMYPMDTVHSQPNANQRNSLPAQLPETEAGIKKGIYHIVVRNQKKGHLSLY